MTAPIIFQLAEINRIAERMEILCGDDDVCFADMIQGETDVVRIIERIHTQIARDEEILVGIAERKANLAEREKRIKGRVATYKATVGKFLRAAKISRLELAEATYSVRDGKPRLEVVNEDAVPDKFCTFVRKPVKAAINEEYADAKALPNWLVRAPAVDVVTARTK
jgi:hypothetical protein